MVGRGGNNLFIPGREKRQEPRGGAPVGGGGLLTPGGGAGRKVRGSTGVRGGMEQGRKGNGGGGEGKKQKPLRPAHRHMCRPRASVGCLSVLHIAGASVPSGQVSALVTPAREGSTKRAAAVGVPHPTLLKWCIPLLVAHIYA